MSKVILCLFALLLATQSSILFDSVSDNKCFEFQRDSEGKTYSSETQDSGFSSSVFLRATGINTCSRPIFLQNYAITTHGWTVNSVLVDNVNFWTEGTPLLITSEPKFEGKRQIKFIINTQPCSSEFECTRVAIPAKATFSINLEAIVFEVIKDWRIDSFYEETKGNGPLCKISGTVENIAPGLIKPLNVVVEDISEVNPGNPFYFKLTPESNKFYVDKLVAGTILKITVNGFVLLDKNVVFGPVSKVVEIISIENSVSFKLVPIQKRAITFSFKENFDNLPAILNLSSQNYSYTKVNIGALKNTIYIPKDEIIKIEPEWTNDTIISVDKPRFNPADSNLEITYSRRLMGGYVDSSGLSIPSQIINHPYWINRIVISSINPETRYKFGNYGTDLSLTGLSSPINSKLKDHFATAKKNNPSLKFLLAVGGTYSSWEKVNYDGIAQIVEDLNADGISLNFTFKIECSNINTAELKCNSDNLIIDSITALREKLPNKIISIEASTTGAYGTTDYPTSKFGPSQPNSGCWVNPLKKVGKMIDEIHILIPTIESRAGLDIFESFNSYKSQYKGNIILGKIMFRQSPAETEVWAKYLLEKRGAGVFVSNILSMFINNLERHYAHSFLLPVCKVFKFLEEDCEKNNIPFF